MALDLYCAYIPSDVPPGHFAGKLVKAVHTDTKHNIFPCDSAYGKDWSEAISYLGRKRRNSANDSEDKMTSARVFLPLEHPLEGRNNPQPSKVSTSTVPNEEHIVICEIFMLFMQYTLKITKCMICMRNHERITERRKLTSSCQIGDMGQKHIFTKSISVFYTYHWDK